MAVFTLDQNEIAFPDPTLGEEDGLLAVGGDLSLDRLLLAYCNGIFPWYNPGDAIMWWCPMDRFVIFPSKIHISKSMKKFLRKHKATIVLNRDFKDTIHRCRLKREFNVGTWISDEMENAYIHLHENGFAISVEAYIDNKLAGGLYGVCIGTCFFGESMFSDMDNGSKVALILFSQLLAQHDFGIIDCQFHTEHLERMGGETIPYEEYMNILHAHL